MRIQDQYQASQDPSTRIRIRIQDEDRAAVRYNIMSVCRLWWWWWQGEMVWVGCDNQNSGKAAPVNQPLLPKPAPAFPTNWTSNTFLQNTCPQHFPPHWLLRTWYLSSFMSQRDLYAARFKFWFVLRQTPKPTKVPLLQCSCCKAVGHHGEGELEVKLSSDSANANTQTNIFIWMCMMQRPVRILDPGNFCEN